MVKVFDVLPEGSPDGKTDITDVSISCVVLNVDGR